MEGIRQTCAFSAMVAQTLRQEDFLLVDVGCLGGIDTGWRAFGPRLKALAIDCDGREIARLAAGEANPAVKYVEALVGLPKTHPLLDGRPAPVTSHNWPGGRLSYQRSIHIRQARARGEAPLPLDDYYRRVVSYGAPTPDTGFDSDYSPRDRYCGPGEEGITYLPHLLAETGFSAPDFFKIDIDGPDFDILRDLAPMLENPALLGVAAEVNFVGSHDANDHTFHNVDRLMRANGFDLFNLTVRRYSSAALPWAYQDAEPALTTGGRPVQGDAIYLRDLASPVRAREASAVSDEKILKLGAIFALLSLPDEAAEMLLVHRKRIDQYIDIDAALDVLALQIQETDQTDLNYQEYVAAFEAEAPQIMDHNGRRARWLAGVIAASKELGAVKADAARKIQSLECRLAEEKALRARSETPSALSGWRRLLGR